MSIWRGDVSWLEYLFKGLFVVTCIWRGVVSCHESWYRGLLVAMSIWRGCCFLFWIFVPRVTCCHVSLKRGFSCLEILYRGLLVIMSTWRGDCFLPWIFAQRVTCCHEYLKRGMFFDFSIILYKGYLLPRVFEDGLFLPGNSVQRVTCCHEYLKMNCFLPWIFVQWITCCHEKNVLKFGRESDILKYKKQRNKVKNMKKKAKENFESNLDNILLFHQSPTSNITAHKIDPHLFFYNMLFQLSLKTSQQRYIDIHIELKR